ncbi:hypothetical protein ACH3XW_10700 [Acanthocheilonema viteae]
MKNITVTLSAAKTLSVNTIPTMATVPQTTITKASLPETVPITDIVNRTIPIHIDVKHEVKSVNTVHATEIIPETKPVNMIVGTETVTKATTSINNTVSGMKPIFSHLLNSHLKSATLGNQKSLPNISNSLLKPVISLATSTMKMTSSSQTVSANEDKIAERSFPLPYLKIEQQKIPQQNDNNDKLKMEPNNIRSKASSTSPIITHSQSAPKTPLDQWKWDMNQQQQLINQNWIDSNDSDNDNHNDHNNIVSNSNTILSSSIFSIPSFLLLLFLLPLLSLRYHLYVFILI